MFSYEKWISSTRQELLFGTCEPFTTTSYWSSLMIPLRRHASGIVILLPFLLQPFLIVRILSELKLQRCNVLHRIPPLGQTPPTVIALILFHVQDSHASVQ